MQRSRSVFAHQLDALLTANVDIPALVQRVKAQGFPISEKNISDWRQGYFLPRSSAAFPLVETLENILGGKPGVLRQALLEDLSGGTSFIPGEFAPMATPRFPAAFSDKRGEKFAIPDRSTDWDAELVREAIEDDIRVSADFKKITHTVSLLACVPAAPNPSLHVPILYGEGEVPDDKESLIYNIEGAVLKNQEIEKSDDGVTAVTNYLELPDGVVPGELYTISYSCDWVSPDPATLVLERYFAWPLRFYLCRVSFEGEVPEKIEYVMTKEGYQGENVTAMVPVGNKAHISLQDVEGMKSLLRWTF